MPYRRRWLNCWPLVRKRPNVHLARLIPPTCCINPRTRRLVRVFIQYGLLGFVSLILVLWLGMEFQEIKVRQADDTLWFYQQPQICGITFNNDKNSTSAQDNATITSSIVIQTWPNASVIEAVRQQTSPPHTSTLGNSFIAHCGDCGQCSNPRDVGIYDETKNTLYDDSVACAKRGLIWGRKTASNCMEDRVGFTSDCNDCWVENIMCDLRKCVFVCLWHGLFSQVDSTGAEDDHPTSLNRCTYCDEKRCGPEFVTCAGANRRRSGILSDIERDQSNEVCSVVENNWWKNNELQETWSSQYRRQQKLGNVERQR
jgi:hypothetical protein